MLAIRVKNLSKTFRLPHERRNTLKDYFLHPFLRNSYEKFAALKNISFEIERGEWVGIIGKNGSGKSTLLKILAGVYAPDNGEVEINGKVIPLLELGVGFNRELSGRENIFLNGAMLGMSKKEIAEKFDAIVDFAEIRKFLDLPLKNYSSGMQVRLAFAIASQVEADIYLLDEVLAVGDLNFQQKCFDSLAKIKSQGKTVIFVSHDLKKIEKICDLVFLLCDGEIADKGDAEEVIHKYSATTNEIQKPENNQKVFLKNIVNKKRYGSRELEITDVKFAEDNEKNKMIKIKYQCKKEIFNPSFGAGIYKKNGEQILNLRKNLNFPVMGQGQIIFILDSESIKPGEYLVSVACSNQEITYIYDHHQFLHTINIV